LPSPMTSSGPLYKDYCILGFVLERIISIMTVSVVIRHIKYCPRVHLIFPRYPISKLKGAYAAFQMPQEFERHMERMVQYLKAVESSTDSKDGFKITLATWIEMKTEDNRENPIFYSLESAPDGSLWVRGIACLLVDRFHPF
jgi:hypothetical protein